MSGCNYSEKYDAKKFKEMHTRRMKGVTYSVQPTGKTRSIRDVFKNGSGNGWIDLAYGIITQAVNDYQKAKRGEPRPEMATSANQLGFESPLEEVQAYFRSIEFVNHCAICGLTPRDIIKRFGILV